MADWWAKVDLTIDGYIGDNEHPNKPWRVRESIADSELYRFFTGKDVEQILERLWDLTNIDHKLLESKDENRHLMLENYDLAYWKYIGKMPRSMMNTYAAYGASYGKECDRCGDELNLLNAEIIVETRWGKRYSGLCMGCVEAMDKHEKSFWS